MDDAAELLRRVFYGLSVPQSQYVTFSSFYLFFSEPSWYAVCVSRAAFSQEPGQLSTQRIEILRLKHEVDEHTVRVNELRLQAKSLVDLNTFLHLTELFSYKADTLARASHLLLLILAPCVQVGDVILGRDIQSVDQGD